jgi:protein SCO1/2
LSNKRQPDLFNIYHPKIAKWQERTKMKTQGINACLKKLLFMAALLTLGVANVCAAPEGSAWGANYFPNVELVDQDGNKVRFYDDLLKDKVFAINFIYTKCMDSCPLETAALRQVEKALGELMGKEVFFYTISIDGDRDNAKALKDYAAKFHAGPGWKFLTGKPEDVVLLRQKLGMYREDGKAEQSLSEHGISILMGNEKAGQWIKRSPFEETQALVRVLGTRLQSKHLAKTTVATIVKGPAESNGESIFRSKCEACHSVGSEDGIGPGLKGVVALRDRAWLKKWIKQPDQLINGEDPIALVLYKKYKEIPMPNLRLEESEVEDLIGYLEASDKKINNSSSVVP